MLVEFRPHARLRGANPLDLSACVTPVLEALAGDSADPDGSDLSRTRVTCDWVQYTANFRDVVDVRPILAIAGAYDREVAVDVRRSGSVPLRKLTAQRLRGSDDLVYLEDWGPGSRGCVWEFNACYWSALALWEKATGRGYEQALPGGSSDGRNRAAAGELVRELFAMWDRLASVQALPPELYVTELGVGNGGQARVLLDEFRELDLARGQGYYQRLHYLMCDYSQHVLDQAVQAVAPHAAHVSSICLDATKPAASLGHLRGKIFLLYISNVYDNLPTDEVAQLGGQSYQVQTRAYISQQASAELSASVSATTEQLPGLVRKLLRLGPALLPDAVPAHFADTESAVAFWRGAWSALRLAERYVPLAELDAYQLAPTVNGELLRPLLESGPDLRMHVSNGALASFTESAALLHPFGKMVCHDLFVTSVAGYRSGFRGPGKYDGSVVNWLNGPLLAHAGRRIGLDVRYEPFRHRSGGNIVTMTAQARD